MKKILAALVLTITFCTCVQAQSNENINPIDVGRAFALKTPAYFKCWLQGQTLVNNVWTQVMEDFILRKSDFATTNLVVNGTAIPLPEPIYGLPLGPGGIIRNVVVNATAYTKSGEYAGNGYTQVDQLLKDGTMEVLLRPSDVLNEAPVDDLAKYPLSDIKVDIDSYIYGYGLVIKDGKLYISTPPIGGKYHYILHSWSTGALLGQGYIEPFKAITTPNSGYFSIRYVGNVIGVDCDDTSENWMTVPNIQFDCSIPTESGTNIIGKVIFTDLGSAGGLELTIGSDVDIHVYKATDENGDMPVLALEDHSINTGWYVEKRINTVLRSGVGKVVITIIPKVNSTIQGSNWLNLHRFYGQPSSVGTVGGKG